LIPFRDLVTDGMWRGDKQFGTGKWDRQVNWRWDYRGDFVKNTFRLATLFLAISMLGFGLSPKSANAATYSTSSNLLDFGLVEIGSSSSLELHFRFSLGAEEYYDSTIDFSNKGQLEFDIATTRSSLSNSKGIISYLVTFTPTAEGILSVYTAAGIVIGHYCPKGETCRSDPTSLAAKVRMTGTGVSVVPLPPSAILFGTALLGLAAIRRRKRKAA